MTATTTRGQDRSAAGAARPTSATARNRADRRADGPLSGLRALARRADSPVTSYYLLVGATTALVLTGLVMVLSASMVTAYKSRGSVFSVFGNQALFAVLGLIAAVIAARIPVRWWRRFAVPSLALAVVLQALVLFTPLGDTVNGNRNWLRLGPVGGQPSELTKVGLVLVGALVLANKRHLLARAGQVLVPYLVPVAAITIGLVLLGHDLGTALVLFGIVGAVLFVAGVPGRMFTAAGLGAVAVAAVLVVTSPNRMGRIVNWLDGSCTDPDGTCGQSVHGSYALADGGWWGVGLGQSKEKAGWLPEAHNDFIFAIIGEELGLPGTLTILLLFALLGYACYRIVARSDDHFVRIATGGVMAWVLLQATVNIGAVIGL
ncbi:MAG TPA: putative peptidoglycan glycosyltransferase FtsW, partial [Dermatophilaceae bacterium]|nr:putative peptidoglycan glycosyltransferase FtsW [Dermatophilaceae bacterium]